jgi:hypothetical protein
MRNRRHQRLRARRSRPHIGVMQHLDLSDEDADALTQHLKRAIDSDRYPLSPRVAPLKAILAKLRPEPIREPLPPPKVYLPPSLPSFWPSSAYPWLLRLPAAGARWLGCMT